MNSNLQNKLFSFEAPPPGQVWERIAEALDGEEETYRKRLYNFEALPPAGSWNAIEASLDLPVQAKVIPFFTRYKTPLRYIAAASIISVMLVMATVSLKRTETGPFTATKGPLTPQQRSITNTVPNNRNKTSSSAIAITDQQTKEKGPVATLKRTLASIRPQNIFPSLKISRRFIPRKATEETDFNFATTENFMVYSDGEGHAMKLSKKLFSLVNCPDGDGSCKERILQLQQKLAANTTPADFMGMVDLVRQLQ